MRWKELLIQFGSPAHKNVSIFIKDITEEDITKTIEDIARDASWTDKEIKETNSGKEISYVPNNSTAGPLLQSLNLQHIQFVITHQEKGFQIDIESRFFITTNKGALLIYTILAFFIGIGWYGFFDFFRLNRRNLEFILLSFELSSPHRLTMIHPIYTKLDTTNITNLDIILSLGVCIAKAFLIFIIALLAGIAIAGCLWFVSAYLTLCHKHLYPFC